MLDWKQAYARLHYHWLGRNRPSNGGRILRYHDVKP